VLVDEAQDVSPMQWRMLGRRGQYASWTIVGDAAQSAWPTLGEAREAREQALRGKQLRRFHLGTNYRNPRRYSSSPRPWCVGRCPMRICRWPCAHRDDPVRRLVARADQRAVTLVEIADLLENVEGTVGVITATARRSEVAAWLADAAGTRALRKAGSRSSMACRPRAWSTTRSWWWHPRNSPQSPRRAARPLRRADTRHASPGHCE
jgi:hypothetical protein